MLSRLEEADKRLGVGPDTDPEANDMKAYMNCEDTLTSTTMTLASVTCANASIDLLDRERCFGSRHHQRRRVQVQNTVAELERERPVRRGTFGSNMRT